MSSLSDAGLKTRLEHGVWLDEVERAFRAWREAPNADKPGLLLSGMVLTWAESWRLTHSEDFSPPIHTYIARSVAAQSNKTSAERESKDLETRRRDRVYQQILLLMAVFAIVVLGPSAMRLYSEHLDRMLGNEHQAETVTPSPEPRRKVAVIHTQEPPEEAAPVPAALQWPPQQLIAQARTDAAAGRRRDAVLYALEALDAADRTPADAKPSDRAKALSVIANLHRETRAMPTAGDAVAQDVSQAPTFICAPQRYVTQGVSGETVIIDGKAGKVHRVGAVQLKDGSLDPSCNSVVLVGEDYDVKVQTFDPARRSMILGTHDAAVVAAGFSGDGRRIVSVSRDAVGKVWDATTGKRVSSFRSNAQMFNGATLSHDGTLVITWSDESTAELWDSTTGKRVGALAGHQGPIMTARFGQDGKSILTVSVDGTAMVWATATRQPRGTLRPKDSSIVDAWLTPDGQTVVARLEEDRILLWPAGADTAAATIELGENKLHSVVISRDGRFVAVVETSGVVGVYSAASGQRLLDLNSGGAPLIGAVFAESGDTLTALTQNSALRWALPLSRETALAVSQASTLCWTPAERTKLKLDPQRPAWCRAAATAGAEVGSEAGTPSRP